MLYEHDGDGEKALEQAQLETLQEGNAELSPFEQQRLRQLQTQAQHTQDQMSVLFGERLDEEMREIFDKIWQKKEGR